ncbi:MAG: alpha/beta hydrolase [Xanthobacteraceae bacterium]|nr:alpha/beta hydrolase [Xanthobacteraceae bacterium]
MTITHQGRAIDYVESGDGSCIVFVPGSFSATAAWRPISQKLEGFRSIATSLPGCGGTDPLPGGKTSAEDYVDLIEAVIDHAKAPVHLVGHSWGGTLAVATALRSQAKLASLILIEANPCDVLRQSGDYELHTAAKKMSGAYIAAYHAGEREAARRVIDFWTGAGTFDALPPKMREYAVQTTPANIIDWPAMFAFRRPLSDYATLELPVLLIHGTASPPSLHRVAEILHAAIPGAKLEKISGASHLLIGTHPGEIADLIAVHVKSAAGNKAASF